MTNVRLDRAASKTLIDLQGGRRYCASCRLLKAADRFKRRTRSGPLLCEACFTRAGQFPQQGSASCKS